MTIIWHRTSRARAVLRTLAFWAVLGVVAWLDADRCIIANQAAYFSYIIVALSYVADAIHWTADFIVAQLVGVVAYLMSAVSWVIRRLANIAISTGTIFAKAWDGLRIFWSRVVRPILQWTDAALRRFESWLRRTFEPVFRFLRAVRTYVDAFYRRFLQPVLDFIGAIRQVNRVLNAFHIHVLDALDEFLARIEDKITSPFLWVYGKINELTTWVNRIVTADGLFQRIALIRSLERDVMLSWRVLTNSRSFAISPETQTQIDAGPRTRTVPQIRAAMTDLSAHGAGDYQPIYEEMREKWRVYFAG